jgi:hypothetical protein
LRANAASCCRRRRAPADERGAGDEQGSPEDHQLSLLWHRTSPRWGWGSSLGTKWTEKLQFPPLQLARAWFSASRPLRYTSPPGALTNSSLRPLIRTAAPEGSALGVVKAMGLSRAKALVGPHFSAYFGKERRFPGTSPDTKHANNRRHFSLPRWFDNAKNSANQNQANGTSHAQMWPPSAITTKSAGSSRRPALTLPSGTTSLVSGKCGQLEESPDGYQGFCTRRNLSANHSRLL